jgi:organic hydroperoxide reductase OsmC/OhrA
MQPFPHHYTVDASVRPEGDALLTSDGVEAIATAPPKEFGGPGNRWSPEALLTAALADCLILNFRGIAVFSQFKWISLRARTVGTVERIEGMMRFTQFDTDVELLLPPRADAERAKKLLHKAESTCPISNSLSCHRHLAITIQFAPSDSAE